MATTSTTKPRFDWNKIWDSTTTPATSSEAVADDNRTLADVKRQLGSQYGSLQQAFQALDTDRNGALLHGELAVAGGLAASPAPGAGGGDTTGAGTFGSFDVNHDGQIQPLEFYGTLNMG